MSEQKKLDKTSYNEEHLLQRIEASEKRIKALETDLKTLKKVHKLPTSFGGKRVLYKAYNGNYALEGGGIGRPRSPPSD